MRPFISKIVFLLALFVSSSAVAQPVPQRPVVLVPGILGSRLCDTSGEPIWGERSSLSNLSRLEITGGPDDIILKPCGVIKEIQILGSLWSMDQYNLLLTSLKASGFEEKKNIFLFDYDWRQSNSESARLLSEFIKRNVGEGKQFDIIAHSMGGIIARIYIDKYNSSNSLSRIVYMGTPFLGSMNTFGTIKEGWGWFENHLAGGQDVIWRAAVSFPSMLELLPRYKDCCYIRELAGQRKPIDIFDAETWQKLGWLPDEYSNGTRFAAFAANLHAAGGLTELLKKPAPNGITEVFFASDVHSTLRRMGMKEGATHPGDWYFSKERGDGTVPVWSAARRPDQSAYDNALPSFAQHPKIFDDKWVVNKLSSTLLKISPSDPDPIAGQGRPSLAVSIDGLPTSWSVDTADIILSTAYAAKNSIVTADLAIKLEGSVANAKTGAFRPVASLVFDGKTTPLSVTEITTSADLENNILRYQAATSSSETGIHKIIFLIDGEFAPSQAYYVLPEP